MKFDFSTKSIYLFIIGAWLLFECLWFKYLGIHFDLEATKYIGEAENILNNRSLSQTRYVFYFSTIAIIFFAMKIKIGLYGAVAINMLFNLFCYLYFFKALQYLFKQNLIPFLTILVLISFWPYQSWTLFLYSESFFYSIVLLLFSHLILFKKLSLKYIISTAIILLLVIISRPLGILFILPTLLFFYFHLSTIQKRYFIVAMALCLIAFNYVVQIVFTTTADWNMQKPFLEENLICDMPTVASAKNLDLSNSSNQLYQLFYYITHNFSHFFGLAIGRLKLFFLLKRDYFSTAHNAYLLSFVTILYGVILFRFKNIVKLFPKALLCFALLTIFLFTLAVAFQCDDYHNRFYLTLTPFFVILAAGGLVKTKALD